MWSTVLERLGAAGVAGCGVLLFCLSFQLATLGPAQDDLARLSRELARIPAPLPGAAPSLSGTGLPPPPITLAPAQVVATLKTLAVLADQHGIGGDRATYRWQERDGAPRLVVILPLRAAYGPLRAWLGEVLALPAGPVLDELLLQRQQATDDLIDAQVSLSFALARLP